MFWERFQFLCNNVKQSPSAVAKGLNISAAAITKWKKGVIPNGETLNSIADYFNVSVDYLLCRESPIIGRRVTSEHTVKVVHIATVAAGFDKFADTEDAELVDVPLSLLKGYDPSECQMITVKGNSMFPRFLEGDHVLFHVQSSVDSGEVAVIQYNGDEVTIKKVNYVEGEDWLELIPINPEYTTKRIEGSELELCRVYGLVIGLMRNL